MKEHGWVKAHAMIGVSTSIVTAVRVTDSDANDCPSGEICAPYLGGYGCGTP